MTITQIGFNIDASCAGKLKWTPSAANGGTYLTALSDNVILRGPKYKYTCPENIINILRGSPNTLKNTNSNIVDFDNSFPLGATYSLESQMNSIDSKLINEYTYHHTPSSGGAAQLITSQYLYSLVKFTSTDIATIISDIETNKLDIYSSTGDKFIMQIAINLNDSNNNQSENDNLCKYGPDNRLVFEYSFEYSA